MVRRPSSGATGVRGTLRRPGTAPLPSGERVGIGPACVPPVTVGIRAVTAGINHVTVGISPTTVGTTHVTVGASPTTIGSHRLDVRAGVRSPASVDAGGDAAHGRSLGLGPKPRGGIFVTEGEAPDECRVPICSYSTWGTSEAGYGMSNGEGEGEGEGDRNGILLVSGDGGGSLLDNGRQLSSTQPITGEGEQGEGGDRPRDLRVTTSSTRALVDDSPPPLKMKGGYREKAREGGHREEVNEGNATRGGGGSEGVSGAGGTRDAAAGEGANSQSGRAMDQRRATDETPPIPVIARILHDDGGGVGSRHISNLASSDDDVDTTVVDNRDSSCSDGEHDESRASARRLHPKLSDYDDDYTCEP